MRTTDRMTESRLILVEGIAGSGKSTVGQYLATILCKENISAHFIHEFDRGHPIREAYLGDISGFIEKIVTRWRIFVNEHDATGITIFDGVLSQLFIAELVLMNAEEETIVDSIHMIVDVIRVLKPHVIHLYQEDIRASILKAYNNRNEVWQKKIDGFIERTTYGKSRNLVGLPGYVSFNQMYGRLLRRIMSDLDLACVSIETTQGEWQAYYKQISEFLTIPLPENSSIETIQSQ